MNRNGLVKERGTTLDVFSPNSGVASCDLIGYSMPMNQWRMQLKVCDHACLISCFALLQSSYLEVCKHVGFIICFANQIHLIIVS